MVARRTLLWMGLVVLFVATSVFANDLTVAPRTLQMTDLVTITVSLEGSFAEVDTVNVPLDNLAFVGEPWVSSEFAWLNGTVVRRKVFRFRARPLVPGRARVGPMVLTASDGQRETMPAIEVDAVADRISATNDPEITLGELIATGRPRLFLVAEANKKEAWAGEQVIVTWYLYNAESVENWQIVSVPKLPDFWTEELDVRALDNERVYVGNLMMMRIPLRRVAVYPIRGGALQIAGMSVEAAVMERTRGGPFSIFEGNLVETTVTSAPLPLNVRGVPAGAAVAAVGELVLQCGAPKQQNGGPVVVEATLSGAGNLRTAQPPRFARPVAGSVQVEGGEATASRDESDAVMNRRWRYLIFPSGSGALEIPPLTMTIFSPSLGQRRDLQCPAATLWSMSARSPVAVSDRGAPPPAETSSRHVMPWLAGSTLALLFGLVAFPRLRRELAVRREARSLAGAPPSEIRARVDERVGNAAALLTERSDRGDAYRALRSLLDAAERDRDIAVDAEEEIARRIAEVLRS